MLCKKFKQFADKPGIEQMCQMATLIFQQLPDLHLEPARLGTFQRNF